jgi:antitoxin (DNA-binding transcriptional repressor) of toxin-antitoxin stability system
VCQRKEIAVSTVTLEEAQARLPELIENLSPGEELIIIRGEQPVAKLVGQARPDRPPRRPGTLRGTVLYMAPDFDAPLEDFKEYME